MMRSSGVQTNGITAGPAWAVLIVVALVSCHANAQDGFRFGPPGFGPPGDSRGYDRGRDYGRDGDRGDRGSSSSSRSSSSGGSSSQNSPVAAPTQVRVTVGLPSTYSEIDADRDGQVGLWEWKKAKRPLAQFMQLDLNQDGFLTPRELERAGSLPVIAGSSPSPSAAPVGTPSPASVGGAASPVASSSSQAPPASATVSKLSEEDQTKADEAQAKSVFSLLDRDRDGKISAEEIARSTRVGPLFQQAGIGFSEPMPEEQFVSNYVRIQKSRRT